MRALNSVLNIPEYALTEFWIYLGSNMPGFGLWQSFEYARVTQGFKYATIWLNISEQDVNMPEYVWIYDYEQVSEHVSYNTQRGVTLQVNEYLLRERHIQNPVKGLRWSALEK